MTSLPRGLSPAEPGFTAAPCGVVGASGRAAAHSLARAGFSAWAVDQFADRDLKRLAACAVCPHDDYPTGIPALAARFPPGPVLYTGGMENHPSVVTRLAAQRELWGNPPEVLARARDLFALFPALAEAGFATPRIVPPGHHCPSEGPWLRKPLRSGGGAGIRFAQPGEAASHDHVFQEFIAGVPMSALFVNAALFGITEQLIGEPWLHAKPFVYCGNIGRCHVPSSVTDAVAELGRTLADLTGLRGVWGLDFVLGGESAFLLEVNPRYTASAEVLEHATGSALFREDLPPQPPSLKGGGGRKSLRNADAFRESEGASRAFTPSLQGGGWGVGSSAGGVGRTVGKAIYYAPETFRFPESGPWDADLTGSFDPWRLPQFADIPEVGNVIEAGWPVLTFFETGSTSQGVRERLQSRAVELDRIFQGSRP